MLNTVVGDRNGGLPREVAQQLDYPGIDVGFTGVQVRSPREVIYRLLVVAKPFLRFAGEFFGGSVATAFWDRVQHVFGVSSIVALQQS